MKQLLSLSLITVLVFTASCHKSRIRGEGSVTSETRYVSAFTSLTADGDVDVDVYPSSENKVIVSGYGNLIPIYQTNVSGNRLTLKYKDGYINVRNNNIRVDVYTTQLGSVKINGSGRMTLHDNIKAERMDAQINGSGTITVNNNKYKYMDLDISGSGDINASACSADNVYANISGSGSVKITVNEFLNARISGSGDVDYWGNPKTVNTDISGSGKVRKQ